MLGSEGKYIFPRYSCVYIPGLSSCRVRIEIHSPLLFLRQSYTRGVGSEWKYLSSSYSGVNQILVLKKSMVGMFAYAVHSKFNFNFYASLQ